MKMSDQDNYIILSDLEEGEILDDDDDVAIFEDISPVKKEDIFVEYENKKWPAATIKDNQYNCIDDNLVNTGKRYSKHPHGSRYPFVRNYEESLNYYHQEEVIIDGHHFWDSRPTTNIRPTMMSKAVKSGQSNHPKNRPNKLKIPRKSPIKIDSSLESHFHPLAYISSSDDDKVEKSSECLRIKPARERRKRIKTISKHKRLIVEKRKQLNSKKRSLSDSSIKFFLKKREETLNKLKNVGIGKKSDQSSNKVDEVISQDKATPGSLGEMLLKKQLKEKAKEIKFVASVIPDEITIESDQFESNLHHSSTKDVLCAKRVGISDSLDCILGKEASNFDVISDKENKIVPILECISSEEGDSNDICLKKENEDEMDLRCETVQSTKQPSMCASTSASLIVCYGNNESNTENSIVEKKKEGDSNIDGYEDVKEDILNAFTKGMCDDMEISDDNSCASLISFNSKLEPSISITCMSPIKEVPVFDKSEDPFPVQWAYMIPPPSAKSDEPNNDLHSINNWCFNQNMCIQTMLDSTKSPSQLIPLSSERPVAAAEVLDLCDMSVYQGSSNDPSTSIDFNSPYQANHLPADLRDNYAEQYRSFMSSVLSHHPIIETLDSGMHKKVGIGNVKKPLCRTLTQVPIKKITMAKRVSPRKRRRKRSNKGMAMIEEEDEDIDLLRAQLLNQMSSKSSKICVPKSTSVKISDPITTSKQMYRKFSKIGGGPARKTSISKSLSKLQVKSLECFRRKIKSSQKRRPISMDGSYQTTKTPYSEITHDKREFSMLKFPKVKPVIINLNDDSDDSDETFSKPAHETVQSVDLCSGIDTLLKSLRNSSQINCENSKPVDISVPSSSNESISSARRVVNLMSSDKQKEYFRLKKLYTNKRRQLQKIKQKSSCVDKSKSLSRLGDYVSMTSPKNDRSSGSENSENCQVSSADPIASDYGINVSEEILNNAQSSQVSPVDHMTSDYDTKVSIETLIDAQSSSTDHIPSDYKIKVSADILSDEQSSQVSPIDPMASDYDTKVSIETLIDAQSSSMGHIPSDYKIKVSEDILSDAQSSQVSSVDTKVSKETLIDAQSSSMGHIPSVYKINVSADILSDAQSSQVSPVDTKVSEDILSDAQSSQISSMDHLTSDYDINVSEEIFIRPDAQSSQVSSIYHMTSDYDINVAKEIVDDTQMSSVDHVASDYDIKFSVEILNDAQSSHIASDCDAKILHVSEKNICDSNMKIHSEPLQGDVETPFLMNISEELPNKYQSCESEDSDMYLASQMVDKKVIMPSSGPSLEKSLFDAINVPENSSILVKVPESLEKEGFNYISPTSVASLCPFLSDSSQDSSSGSSSDDESSTSSSSEDSSTTDEEDEEKPETLLRQKLLVALKQRTHNDFLLQKTEIEVPQDLKNESLITDFFIDVEGTGIQEPNIENEQSDDALEVKSEKKQNIKLHKLNEIVSSNSKTDSNLSTEENCSVFQFTAITKESELKLTINSSNTIKEDKSGPLRAIFVPNGKQFISKSKGAVDKKNLSKLRELQRILPIKSQQNNRLHLLNDIKDEYTKKFVGKNITKNKIATLLKATTQISAQRQTDLRKIADLNLQLKELRYQEKMKALHLRRNVTNLTALQIILDKDNEALAQLEKIRAKV